MWHQARPKRLNDTDVEFLLHFGKCFLVPQINNTNNNNNNNKKITNKKYITKNGGQEIVPTKCTVLYFQWHPVGLGIISKMILPDPNQYC